MRCVETEVFDEEIGEWVKRDTFIGRATPPTLRRYTREQIRAMSPEAYEAERYHVDRWLAHLREEENER